MTIKRSSREWLRAGLVASLRRPSANVTGVSGQAADIVAKQLELLKELIPGGKPIAVLGNPDTPYTALALQQVNAGAGARERRSRLLSNNP
jgi:putative ABC transport system substrate-binding protein